MNGYLAVIDLIRTGTAAHYIGGSATGAARVFPGDPQEGQAFPCISVENYDSEAFDTTSGAATTDHDLVKVICYATTDSEAKSIAAACRADLDEQTRSIVSNGVTYLANNIRYLRFDSYDVHLTNRRARVHEQDYEVRITKQ